MSSLSFFGAFSFMLFMLFLSMAGLTILCHRSDGIALAIRAKLWLCFHLIAMAASGGATAYLIVLDLFTRL